MRVSLTGKYQRHKHWWISSYLTPYITAGYGARLFVEAVRQSCARGEVPGLHARTALRNAKSRAAATAAGFAVNSEGDVCGFPYEFKPTTCKFWVDLAAVGYDDKSGSGMYPHEWDRIKQESTTTLDVILEAKLRETLKIGNIVVPLFWYPTSRVYAGMTLREYMEQHKLRTGV